jgi:hypothetical protein
MNETARFASATNGWRALRITSLRCLAAAALAFCAATMMPAEAEAQNACFGPFYSGQAAANYGWDLVSRGYWESSSTVSGYDDFGNVAWWCCGVPLVAAKPEEPAALKQDEQAQEEGADDVE